MQAEVGASETLNNCIITCSHNVIFEAEQIVFHENLIKYEAKQAGSQYSVDNHDLQLSTAAGGKRRVGLVHQISPGACCATRKHVYVKT